MARKLLIINGPNLNLLGRREPHLYGRTSMADCLNSLRNSHPELQIDFFQSNCEGALIDRIQQADNEGYDGMVLNAGAYTHTSLALADAVASISIPVIEVHISNVWSREKVRHTSLLSPVCRGVIAGLGLKVYALATQAFLLQD